MKIGIAGCTGRVGQLLIEELQSGAWEGTELSGGYARDLSKLNDATFFTTDNVEELFEKSDIIIDFTLPEATRNHIKLAAKLQKALVIGTSGLTDEDEKNIEDAAKSAPIVYAPNTSIGVNLLFALVEEAAKRLGDDWDAEILDLHHKYKVDAPSGTSYALAKAVQNGRGKEFTKEDLTLAREGYTGKREAGTIGFSVQRGGDVTAENSTIFFGMGERLEITHKASDRGIFARGAIKAAQWLSDKPAGLYSMKDVLSL